MFLTFSKPVIILEFFSLFIYLFICGFAFFMCCFLRGFLNYIECIFVRAHYKKLIVPVSYFLFGKQFCF